jgi:hypothetical protein
MLTTRQKRALAREARNLAMECVEGTAPVLARHWYDCGERCAFAWAQERAGCGLENVEEFGERDWWSVMSHLGGFKSEIGAAASLVAVENDAAADTDRACAVVFPLLALADALEEASKASAAQPPPEEK